jgi:hypothetical protein
MFFMCRCKNKITFQSYFCQTNQSYVRFQVLKAVSIKFRIVFWDVLPCTSHKTILKIKAIFKIVLIKEMSQNLLETVLSASYERGK